MSVHYKFKSTLDFDTITFDGLHISVGDLKREITLQKHLGKLTDFDLQITNAQTKEEYVNDSTLIPKNTSLVIARIPIVHQNKRSWESHPERAVEYRGPPKVESSELDISKMKGTEEDKIQAMMHQSTADYDPKSYLRIRSQNQTGEVPSSYRCNKCKKAGHWIKNCPFTGGKDSIEFKRNTGIPRSFRDKEDKPLEQPEQPSTISLKQEDIPEDLLCGICHDLFVDAVMIPCCGSSFCDDCVRTALLESEENECPDCKEKGCSPGSLIPNRFLRNSVNAFRNETGYKTVHSKKTNSDVNTPELNVPNNNEEEEEEKNIEEPNNTDKEKTENEEPLKAEPIENDQKVENSEEAEATDKQSYISNVVDNGNGNNFSPNGDDAESDYEDNITVKVPPAHTESQPSGFHEHPTYNMPHQHRPPNPLNPPGTENLFRNHMQGSQMPPHEARWLMHNSQREYREGNINNQPMVKHDYYRPQAQGPPHHLNPLLPFPGPMQNRLVRPPNVMEPFSNAPIRNIFPHMTTHSHVPHGIRIDSLGRMCNPMVDRPNMGYMPQGRPPHHYENPEHLQMRRPLERDPSLSRNLTTVYEGVAAKVGTGIIDDPLEVFNRIMKEKEKRKKRHGSPGPRRSSSKDRQYHKRHRFSPCNQRMINEPYPKKEDRRRDRYQEQRQDRPMPRKHSNSFSDRSSRSRSWSGAPIVKRSKSPYKQNFRSRTTMSRERERERDRERDRDRERERERSSHYDKTHSNVKLYEHKHVPPTSDRSNRSPVHKNRRDAFLENKRARPLERRSPEKIEPPPPGYEGSSLLEYREQNVKPQHKFEEFMPTQSDHDSDMQKEFEENRSLNKACRNSSENNFVGSLTPTIQPKEFEIEENIYHGKESTADSSNKNIENNSRNEKEKVKVDHNPFSGKSRRNSLLKDKSVGEENDEHKNKVKKEKKKKREKEKNERKKIKKIKKEKRERGGSNSKMESEILEQTHLMRETLQPEEEPGNIDKRKDDDELNIHGRDSPTYEFSTIAEKTESNKNVIVASVPELSKWETDDHMVPSGISSAFEESKNSKTDMLRSPEKLSFTRTVMRSNPQLLKKFSPDRKLYEQERRHGSRASKDLEKGSQSLDVHHNTEKDPSGTRVIKSIKDRLGSKIVSSVSKQSELKKLHPRGRSPTRDAEQKHASLYDDAHNEHHRRSRSRGRREEKQSYNNNKNFTDLSNPSQSSRNHRSSERTGSSRHYRHKERHEKSPVRNMAGTIMEETRSRNPFNPFASTSKPLETIKFDHDPLISDKEDHKSDSTKRKNKQKNKKEKERRRDRCSSSMENTSNERKKRKNKSAKKKKKSKK